VLSVLLSQDRFGPLASTAAANERQNESDMAIRSVLLHNIVQRDLFVSVVTLKRRLVQIAYQEKFRRRQFRYFARHSLTSFCE
jgi:hypothetical protein